MAKTKRNGRRYSSIGASSNDENINMCDVSVSIGVTSGERKSAPKVTTKESCFSEMIIPVTFKQTNKCS